MGSYEFLKTTKTRRIRLLGNFAWTRKISIDATQAHRYGGTGTGGGWEIYGKFRKNPVCFVGFGQAFDQGLSGTPAGPQITLTGSLFFAPYTEGPISADGIHHDALLKWTDAAGAVVGSLVIPWGGDDGDPPPGPQPIGSGWMFDIGVHATDIEWSDSGSYEYGIDVVQTMATSYTSSPPISEVEVDAGTPALRNTVRFYETEQVGGTKGWTVKGAPVLGGLTTIATAVPVSQDLYFPFAQFSISTDGDGSSVSLSATWEGGGAVQIPMSGAASGGWGSASESSATAAAGASNSVGVTAKFPCRRKMVCNVSRIHVDTPASDAMEIQWLTGGFSLLGLTESGTGPISRTFDWFYRSTLIVANGSTVSSGLIGSPSIASLTYPDVVGVKLSSASITATKASFTAFALRGEKWRQFTIQQSSYQYLAQYPFAPIIALGTRGWRKASGLAVSTLSVVASKLHWVLASGTFTASDRGIQLVGDGHRLEGRFVNVRIRSVGSANQPFILTLTPSAGTPSVFTDATGADGEWVERVFDRYDLITANYTTALPHTSYDSVSITGCTAGATYEMEFIRAERHTHSRAAVLGRIYGITDTLQTMTQEIMPSVLLSNLVTVAPTAAGENPFSWQIVDVAAPRSDLPDIFYGSPPANTYLPYSDYFNSANEAYHLQAGGWDRDGGFLDRFCDDTPADLYCTHLSLLYTGYPCAGDVFGTAYADTTTLEWMMLLRSQLYGPILGGGDGQAVLTELDPTTGADVSEAGRGSALPDTFYTTGMPYARRQTLRGGVNHRPWMDPDYPSTGITLNMGDRHRTWMLWRSVGSGALTVDVSHSHRTLRGSLSAGVLLVGYPNNLLASSWTDATTGLSLLQPCLRFDQQSGRVWLYHTSGGAVQRRYSDDEGSTWSMATTVFASGTQPTFFPSHAGVHYAFCRTTGGGITSSILDGWGNVLASGITVVAANVADSQLTAWVNEASGLLFVMYRATDGTTVTVSSPDGLTYS